MPNTYFKFKQFSVKQDKCAMKVCTDACLFGAFAADRLPLTINRLLDIGTGTGLLSLMLAQKNAFAKIDAVEIDEAAAKQAEENFNASQWKEKLKIHNTSVQQFSNSVQEQYDAIICNPPFFENDLKSENTQRNLALHSDALSLEELISAINILLTNGGILFTLLSFHRTNYFEELLFRNKLHVKEKVFIKQTPGHNYFRTMFLIDRYTRTSHQSEIIIMNDENEYSKEFKILLKEYYLNF